MKIIFFILMMIPLIAAGQEVKDEHKDKMELFASETGISTKLIYYKLERLVGNKGVPHGVDADVLEVIKNGETKYFYRLRSRLTGVDNAIASVEYSDLKIVRHAIESLEKEIAIDVNNQSDVTMNYFTTEDYFRVGYYIKKNKVTWFIELDRLGTNREVEFLSNEPIIRSIDEAISKIEMLSNKEESGT